MGTICRAVRSAPMRKAQKAANTLTAKRGSLRGRIVAGALLAISMFGVMVARGLLPDRSSSPKDLEETLGRDLCRSRDLSRSNPVKSAELFHQKVHGPLHGLADRTAEVDRAIAADLLEAKFDVERSAAQSPPSDDLTAHLEALSRATKASLSSLGMPVPDCLENSVQKG